MAKKDMFKLCLVAAVTMTASTSLAAGLTSSTVLGGGTFSPSNKVTINVIATATNYAAKSGHTNGDRTMFTNNTDPKMYYTTKATGTNPETVSGATETVSWTTL